MTGGHPWKERAASETSTTKRCSKCEKLKDLDDFPKDKRGRKGRMGRCKNCWYSYLREYNKRPKEQERRLRYKQNPEVRKRSRELFVLSQYGPEGLEAEKRRKKKNARCDGCGRKLPLKIDHCHNSKAVRGVLCHNCNVTLGLNEDDPERLRALAEYLEHWA